MFAKFTMPSNSTSSASLSCLRLYGFYFLFDLFFCLHLAPGLFRPHSLVRKPLTVLGFVLLFSLFLGQIYSNIIANRALGDLTKRKISKLLGSFG